SFELNSGGCNRMRRSANAVFQKFQIEFGGLVVWNRHTTTKLEKPKNAVWAIDDDRENRNGQRKM
ncbi:hypothetical protein, partial [Chromobacterium piscinae]|uniref:hypothetical protein n=1 Tax=Chromobacterium piscinae TaxID=686831 RepID=UPI003260D770